MRSDHRPVCPVCSRRHWELMSTEAAAKHCHMTPDRFRAALKAGRGPRAWTADIYRFPRYHVLELDRWLSTVQVMS